MSLLLRSRRFRYRSRRLDMRSRRDILWQRRRRHGSCSLLFVFDRLDLGGSRLSRSGSIFRLARRRGLTNLGVRPFARDLEADLQDNVVVQRAGVRLLVVHAELG
jgi:hypothetical protein